MVKHGLSFSFLLLAIHFASASQLAPRVEIPPLLKRAVNDCVPGQFYDSSTTTCKPCPAGSYSKEARRTSCLAARAGYYVPNSGATADTPCSAGSYSGTTGQTACTPCPAGYKCPSSALSQPQGCSPGTYNSATGQSACQNCPAGQFNSVQAATGCCSCCAGWFNGNPGLTNCQRCGNQTPYSSPGTGSMSGCSNTMGMYAPVSSCSQSGRNCPITYTDGPSHMVRREVKRPTCKKPGYMPCPVIKRGARTTYSGFECVDVQNDLWSCGGCIADHLDNEDSPDGARDCSGIPHVNDVSCQRGKCVIESCAKGYHLSGDGNRCDSLRVHEMAKDLFQEANHEQFAATEL